jgi:hypothetical protein
MTNVGAVMTGQGATVALFAAVPDERKARLLDGAAVAPTVPESLGATRRVRASIPWLLALTILVAAGCERNAPPKFKKVVAPREDPASRTVVPEPEAVKPPPTSARARELLARIARELPAALAASRKALLGNRTADSPTCCPYRPPGFTAGGYKNPPKGDPHGGPGSQFLRVWTTMNPSPSPSADYAWHQGPFRRKISSWRTESRKASALLAPVAETTRALREEFRQWARWRDGITLDVPPSPAGGWPYLCLRHIATAAGTGAGNLERCRTWAAELASTLVALEDLHRWLEFVAGNHLDNLDYQTLGKNAYDEMDDHYRDRYRSARIISRFPGGSLSVSAVHNYLEVERQAERHFFGDGGFDTWEAAVKSSRAILADVPAAVWMPPDLRQGFADLRAKLSPANQATWDHAAAMPYERSFLANHLYRPMRAGAGDRVATTLARFDRVHPKATVDELMDVLVHRAGLGMSGVEWCDRFDKRIMDAADALRGDDQRTMLLAAHRWAYDKVYVGSHNYKNLVMSLRETLDTHKYDCIRGTDLVAALYRGAGWPGFVSVRWARTTTGHTTGGVAYADASGKRQVLMVDSLFPTARAQGMWPEAFFRTGGDLYAVELGDRGLDNYVITEAYLVRGPNAGTLVRFRVPYLPGCEKASRTKVYDGPYPDEKVN